VTIVTLGFLGGSMSASRLSSRIRIDRMVLLGSAVALAASALALGLALGGIWTVWGAHRARGRDRLRERAVDAERAGRRGRVRAGTRRHGVRVGRLPRHADRGDRDQIVGAFQDATPLPIAIAMTLASIGALVAAWSALTTCPEAVRAAKPAGLAH
jgi:hypothetical protein